MKKLLALLLSLVLLTGCAGGGLSDILGTDPQEEEGKHSALLLNVLNDSYYNKLVERARNDHDFLETPYFEPHPYGFLEDQGIDTEKIKNGTYEAYSMSYVLDEEPNNLYISTRVLIDESYYELFLLKYKLTNQEMKDYCALHGTPGEYRSQYIHCVFLNDELSQLKTPEIVAATKADAYGFDSLHRTLSTGKYYSNKLGSNYTCTYNPPSKNDTELIAINYPMFYPSSSASQKGIIGFDSWNEPSWGFKFNGSIWEVPIYVTLTLNSRTEKNATVFSTEELDMSNILSREFNLEATNN